jgi:hypothetical protein
MGMSDDSYSPDTEKAEYDPAQVDAEEASEIAVEGEVGLERALQRRTALIFASTVSLIYLSAPVLYIGFTQAALLERLGASKTVANLPSAAYLLMAPLTVVAAWLVPQARLLRKAIAVSFFATAAIGAIVTAVLVVPGRSGTGCAFSYSWCMLSSLAWRTAWSGHSTGRLWRTVSPRPAVGRH